MPNTTDLWIAQLLRRLLEVQHTLGGERDGCRSRDEVQRRPGFDGAGRIPGRRGGRLWCDGQHDRGLRGPAFRHDRRAGRGIGLRGTEAVGRSETRPPQQARTDSPSSRRLAGTDCRRAAGHGAVRRRDQRRNRPARGLARKARRYSRSRGVGDARSARRRVPCWVGVLASHGVASGRRWHVAGDFRSTAHAHWPRWRPA